MDGSSEGLLTVENTRSWTSKDIQCMSFGHYHAVTAEYTE